MMETFELRVVIDAETRHEAIVKLRALIGAEPSARVISVEPPPRPGEPAHMEYK
jgi:hypothetical protein